MSGPGLILDHRGNRTPPVQAKSMSNGLFDISRDSQFRKWRPNISRDLKELMPQWRTQALVSDSRHVYTKSGGLVAATVHGKADAVTGEAWRPVYMGQDADFKRVAEPAMATWLDRSDVRGSDFDWLSNVWTGSKEIDVGGDFFIVFTYAQDGKYPLLKYIESHRVGNRFGQDKVEKGSLKGNPISHGIVSNRSGRAIAIQILGATEKEDEILSMRSVARAFDPRWFSQLRGIPSLAFSILDWYDIGEIKEGEKIANKVFSKLTLMKKTASGKAPSYAQLLEGADHMDTDGNVDLSAPGIEQIADGMIQYVKNTGDLEAFTADRPGNGWLPFMEYLTRGAIEGCDWPAELVMRMNLSGAAARSVVKRANRSAKRRRNVLSRPFRRGLLHGASGLIGMEEIPFTDDWWNWDFTKSEELSLDDGNDRKAEREDFKLGFTDRRTVIEKRHSMPYESWIDRTIADEKLLTDKCDEAGLDIQRISMLTPNGNEKFDDTGKPKNEGIQE